MASVVRPIPATSASSAPRDAAAAETRTTGFAHVHPAACATSASGALDAAVADAPSTTTVSVPTIA